MYVGALLSVQGVFLLQWDGLQHTHIRDSELKTLTDVKGKRKKYDCPTIFAAVVVFFSLQCVTGLGWES